MTKMSDLNWIRATDDPDAECIEVAAGEGDLVHLRQSDDPENVVTTTQAKWDAFVLGVQNNEFDHFVEGVDLDGAESAAPAASHSESDQL
ncbi:DUF397 domain-containing protein [Streptomyces sp. N2-109]|uniref:DUF397 domain-containing protein n=1 Tax=Streptomyces gossypii TaxID=2883101 RepID=A0ABT2K0C7_9ACTN|nr:DUF397 domain-containing protein [Streptomyces gossypii]MCT2592914.1 DUF397 domain-containing protein [Streptomyces gossypii]